MGKTFLFFQEPCTSIGVLDCSGIADKPLKMLDS